MPKGGARVGAGRRKGLLNRKTQAIAKDMVASGAITPLEVMMKAMALHADSGNWDRAAAVAKDAAPYMHPRLASVEHAGKDGGPIKGETTLIYSGVLARLDEKV